MNATHGCPTKSGGRDILEKGLTSYENNLIRLCWSYLIDLPSRSKEEAEQEETSSKGQHSPLYSEEKNYQDPPRSNSKNNNHQNKNNKKNDPKSLNYNYNKKNPLRWDPKQDYFEEEFHRTIDLLSDDSNSLSSTDDYSTNTILHSYNDYPPNDERSNSNSHNTNSSHTTPVSKERLEFIRTHFNVKRNLVAFLNWLDQISNETHPLGIQYILSRYQYQPPSSSSSPSSSAVAACPITSLRSLGYRHLSRYTVGEEDFQLVGEITVETFERLLGEEKFTKDMREAWLRGWHLMSYLMMRDQPSVVGEDQE